MFITCNHVVCSAVILVSGHSRTIIVDPPPHARQPCLHVKMAQSVPVDNQFLSMADGLKVPAAFLAFLKQKNIADADSVALLAAKEDLL